MRLDDAEESSSATVVNTSTRPSVLDGMQRNWKHSVSLVLALCWNTTLEKDDLDDLAMACSGLHQMRHQTQRHPRVMVDGSY